MESISVMVHIIYSLLVFVFLLLIYEFVSKVCKTKYAKRAVILFSAFHAIAFSIGTHYVNSLSFIYIMMILVGIIYFKVLFKIDVWQSNLITCFFVLNVAVVKSITLGCLSMILFKSSHHILSDELLKGMSIIISQTFISLVIYMYIRYVDVKLVRELLLNKKQLQTSLLSFSMLLIFAIFSSLTYYFDTDITWFASFHIIFGIVTFFVTIFIFRYAEQLATMKHQRLQEQKQLEVVQTQIKEQSAYTRMSEIIRSFKYQYRETMILIETKIEEENYGAAIRLLKEDSLTILDALPQSKKYSNNILLNSLFIDFQMKCDVLQIGFDVLLYYPEKMKLSDGECHELFRILTEEAMKVNEDDSISDKHIHIRTDVDKRWFRVIMESTYGREVPFKNLNQHVGGFHEGEYDRFYLEDLIDEHEAIFHIEEYPDQGKFKIMLLIGLTE